MYPNSHHVKFLGDFVGALLVRIILLIKDSTSKEDLLMNIFQTLKIIGGILLRLVGVG